MDARFLTADGSGLEDLTGNGRDAIFGADAAAPLVLSHDGRDYVHIPYAAGTNTNGLGRQTGNNPTWNSKVVVEIDYEVTADSRATTSSSKYILTSYGQFNLWYANTTLRFTMPGVGSGIFPGHIMPAEGTRETLRLEFTAAGDWAVYADGALVGSGNNPAVTPGTALPRIGIGSDDIFRYVMPMNVYSASITVDDVVQYEMLPGNVSDDYKTISNTGAAGGDWIIGRATSGFKTAVVDRGLLLFGGGQRATCESVLPPSTEQTLLVAYRTHGTNSMGANSIIDTGSSTSAPDGPNARGFLLQWRTDSTMLNSFRATNDDNINDARNYFDTEPTGQKVRVGVHSDQIKYYRDGTVVYSGPPLAAFPNASDNNPPIIGGQWSGGHSPVTGGILEFISAAIFDRALTEEEIEQATLELLSVPHTEQPDPHPQCGGR